MPINAGLYPESTWSLAVQFRHRNGTPVDMSGTDPIGRFYAVAGGEPVFICDNNSSPVTGVGTFDLTQAGITGVGDTGGVLMALLTAAQRGDLFAGSTRYLWTWHSRNNGEELYIANGYIDTAESGGLISRFVVENSFDGTSGAATVIGLRGDVTPEAQTARDQAVAVAATAVAARDVVTATAIEVEADAAEAEAARDAAVPAAATAVDAEAGAVSARADAVAANALAQTASTTATAQATAAQNSANAAATSASSASTSAAWVAAMQSGLYASTSDGLTASAEGEYFAVASTGDDYAILYQEVAGVAVEINRLPGLTLVQTLGQSVPLIENWVWLKTDVDGLPVHGLDIDGVEWIASNGVLTQLSQIGMFSGGIPSINHTIPLVETWTTLLLDINGRTVSGVMTDGTHWLAVDGVLVQTDPALSRTVPLIETWATLVLDVNDQVSSGVKTDGSHWQAVDDVLVQTDAVDTAEPLSAWEWDYLTGITALNSSVAVDMLILVLGQSWAEGYSPSGTVVTAAAEHAGFALMPDCGANPNGRAITAYADLKEEVYSSINRETICSGMADRIMLGVDAALGFKPRIVFAVAAKGGEAYGFGVAGATGGLKRGSDTYEEMIRIIDRCVAISTAAGRKLIVPAIVIHHEAVDAAYGKDIYSRALTQWHATVEDDILARTKQTERVRAYVNQSQFGPSAGDVVGTRPVGPMAQLEIPDKNPAFRCLGPAYYVANSGDNSHPPPIDYRAIGQHDGDVLLKDLFGPYWTDLRVIDAWFTAATNIRLEFSKAVAVETTDTRVTISTLGAGKGVDFHDGSVTPPTVTAIAVSASPFTYVDVTLSGASSGFRPEIFIATRRTASGLVIGNVDGMRSGIRERTAFATDTLTGLTHYHWAAHQIVPVTKG